MDGGGNRLSGYLILTSMYFTVILAVKSADWVVQHSNWLQRDAAVAGVSGLSKPLWIAS